MPSLTPDYHERNIAEFDALPDSALVSIATFAGILGVNINTAWRGTIKDPRFPKKIRLSARCTRFKVGDVRAYLQAISK